MGTLFDDKLLEMCLQNGEECATNGANLSRFSRTQVKILIHFKLYTRN